ncbi:MAG: SAM-dependent methyltransferase [Bacteroidales bacterium]|nr:SAM-dependent methyltransferase [Bacteroidales bacterium]
MKLPSSLDKYTKDSLRAIDAQRQAEFIAWGPVVFQVSRLMIKFGIFELMDNSAEGLTREEIVKATGLSDYAVKCMTEASLSIGTIIIDPETERFSLSKTGWFLLNDKATRANIDFNHDVNYEAWFRLEESFREGRPAGLEHFGPWPTVYEGLSSLPPQVQKSWFGFDHLYSDLSFPEALEVVFRQHRTKTLYDVGGNTGKWALQCVGFDKDVKVTILDLPQQIELMRANVAGKPGAGRISGHGINLLDKEAEFPTDIVPDAIWMSQFLDCFSMEEITGILKCAAKAMGPQTNLFIMETLWDRQRFETATFCLTMTSLYFTAVANGNSKMYNTSDLTSCIEAAGLKVEKIVDNLGRGHSILVCRKEN